MMSARVFLRRALLIAPIAVGMSLIVADDRGAGEQITRPVASLPPRDAAAPPSANPLWEVPLGSLVVTRNRPLFAPTRRPPPNQNLAGRSLPSSPAARPPFLLVGAIAAENESVAILVDGSTKAVVRLRQGESHSGWTLEAVKPREVMLRSDRQSAVLELGSK